MRGQLFGFTGAVGLTVELSCFRISFPCCLVLLNVTLLQAFGHRSCEMSRILFASSTMSMPGSAGMVCTCVLCFCLSLTLHGLLPLTSLHYSCLLRGIYDLFAWLIIKRSNSNWRSLGEHQLEFYETLIAYSHTVQSTV